MRGTVAKRIRKAVYGDLADVRKYAWRGFFRKAVLFGKNKKNVDVPTQIQATGLRAEYQLAKRAYLSKAGKNEMVSVVR